MQQRASRLESVVDADPPTVRLTVGSSEWIDYSDDASDIGDTETVDIVVADDAVLNMLSADGWTDHSYDFAGFVDLLAFIEEGNCALCDPNAAQEQGSGPGCPDRCVWTSWGYIDGDGIQHHGMPSYLGVALFNADGELQQFAQAYDP